MSFYLRHFYTRSSTFARYRGGEKRGVLRVFNGAATMWLALALVALLQMPTLASATLLLTQADSDHEIRCSVVADEICVTLTHHADVGRPTHQHTALERILISSSTDDTDHPDHRFSFSQPSAIDLKRIDALMQAPVAIYSVTDFQSHAYTTPLEWSSLSRPLFWGTSGHPPETPSRRRAGTVLRS